MSDKELTIQTLISKFPEGIHYKALCRYLKEIHTNKFNTKTPDATVISYLTTDKKDRIKKFGDGFYGAK